MGAPSVTVSMEGSKGACKEITVPEWQPRPDLPGPLGWAHLLQVNSMSDLDIRAVDGGVLVGVFVLPNDPDPGPKAYSPSKYRVDLATGQVRNATENEWAGMQPSSMYRRSMQPGNRAIVYEGKQFVRRGTQWPIRPEHAARLSPDGTFLVVNSWDGEMKLCPELLPLGCQTRIQGTYYVDIYDAESATLALSLEGQFQGFDPSDLFWRSAWASKDFYVLPLDSVKLNRFVFCDIRQLAPKK
jgi:hypothetical protein